MPEEAGVAIPRKLLRDKEFVNDAIDTVMIAPWRKEPSRRVDGYLKKMNRGKSSGKTPREDFVGAS